MSEMPSNDRRRSVARKQKEMKILKVYAFSTPNSVRVPIALEELGLSYEIEPINVRKGEQKRPDYLAVNQNGKVPVLVDPEGPDGTSLTLTESGAILIYLAEKTGRLLPAGGAVRARVFEQMFFHLTAVGPALGQLGFFKMPNRIAPTTRSRLRLR
jgi:GST-like protein